VQSALHVLQIDSSVCMYTTSYMCIDLHICIQTPHMCTGRKMYGQICIYVYNSMHVYRSPYMYTFPYMRADRIIDRQTLSIYIRKKECESLLFHCV